MANSIALDYQNPDNIAIAASKDDFYQWATVALLSAKEYADKETHENVSAATISTTSTTEPTLSPFDMTVRIVGINEGKELNNTYRHKDYATNVLSFPFEAPEGVEVNLLGDIVICAPVVNAEADEQHKSERSHWAHLTIHGTLHLLGFDHIEDSDAEVMEAIEVNAMAQLGYPDPYEDHTLNP